LLLVRLSGSDGLALSHSGFGLSLVKFCRRWHGTYERHQD